MSSDSTPMSTLRIDDWPRLHGLLLSAEQRIDDSGGAVFGSLLVSLIVCYFLIANGVVLGDIDLAEYNVWHSYVFLFIGHFVLFGVLNERSEKAAYQELREEILAEIRARGFDLFAVISAIEEGTGGEMKQVAAMLKKEEQA
jgi:hypothetical protein